MFLHIYLFQGKKSFDHINIICLSIYNKISFFIYDPLNEIVRFTFNNKYSFPSFTNLICLQGTDITEAFESHHLNPAVNKVLEKYYVKKAQTPRNSPFTFKDDGFFRSLKRAVWAELQNTPKHIQRRADSIIDGLFVTFLVSCAMSCVSKNYWVVMASYLMASLCLAWQTVAAHNYIHKKTNWRMYLFNFSLWSYRYFIFLTFLCLNIYV